MRLIATKSMSYAGKRLADGDEFEPRTARDARILKAIGKASDVTDTAEAEPEAPAAKETRQKRTYKRRDLTAED